MTCFDGPTSRTPPTCRPCFTQSPPWWTSRNASNYPKWRLLHDIEIDTSRRKRRRRLIRAVNITTGNPGANFPDLVPREEAARAATASFVTNNLGSVTASDGERSDFARNVESLLLFVLLVTMAAILHLFPPAPYFE